MNSIATANPLRKTPSKAELGLGFALAAFVGAQGLVACSLAPPPGHSITISLPQSSGTATAATRDKARNASGPSLRDDGPAATSFSSFNCFAINVTAADIPADPNTPSNGCAGIPLGIIAGFVSSSQGSITVSVPDGSSRLFQLIGVPSSAGCPNLDSLLAAGVQGQGNSDTQGLGNPYLLGSATTDISANTAITITAGFNASTSQQLFQCGGNGGPQYPPTAVWGAITDHASAYASPSDSFDFPFQFPPAAALDASEFNSVGGSDAPVALSVAAAASSVPGFGDNSSGGGSSGSGSSGVVGSSVGVTTNTVSPVVAGQGVQELVSSAGYRSVIQLQWDATSWDLRTNLYANISLVVSGGIEQIASSPTCMARALAGPAFAAAAVYDFVRKQWLPLSQSQLYNNGVANSTLTWNGGSNGYAPVLASEFLIPRPSDGHKIILVNVESNYIAGGGNGCSSSVHVAEAGISLQSQPLNQNNNSGSLSMYEAVGLAMQKGNEEVSTPLGGFFGVLTNGGTPPYQYSVVPSGGFVLGSIDPITGFYKAPTLASGEIGTDVITVTDQAGGTAELNVSIVNPGTPNGMLVQGIQVNQVAVASAVPLPLTAGDCVALTLSATGFGYAPIDVSTAVPLAIQVPNGPRFVSPAFPPAATPYSNDNACSSGVAAAWISGTSITWSFQVTGASATPGSITVGMSGLPGATVPIKVAPEPGNILGISSSTPNQITKGECIPMNLVLQDSYGNDATSGAPITASIASYSVATPYPTALYSNSSCGTALSSVISTGTPIPVWFMSNPTATVPPAGVAGMLQTSSALIAPWNFQVVPVTVPTFLHMQALESAAPGACIGVLLEEMDSNMTAALPTTSGNTGQITFNFNGPEGQIYANPGCSGSQLSFVDAGSNGSVEFYLQIPSNAPANWSMSAYQVQQSACDTTSACISNSTVLTLPVL